jgi:hypothetical protein
VRKRDYEVGYCLPPVEHRFQRGNKANTKGRKKGSKSRKVMIEDVLFEPITVREGDKIKRISKLEAVLKKTLSQALGGDKKAQLIIIGLAQKEGLLGSAESSAAQTLFSDDETLLQIFAARVLSGAAAPSGLVDHGKESVQDGSSSTTDAQELAIPVEQELTKKGQESDQSD